MALSNNPCVLGAGLPIATGGAGLVSGPSSSTDNSIVRWDGTGGNLVQNSVLIVADTTGALSGFTTGNGITWHGGGTITGASGALTATTAAAQNFDVDPGTTGLVRFVATALASTSTSLVRVVNDTAATGGATVQMSPRLAWRGHAWDTSASQTVDFFIENLPATAATPTGTFKVGYSLNGAAATYPMTLSSAGVLTIANAITSTAGGITTAATTALEFSTRSRLRSPANSQFTLLNAGETDFSLLQFGGTTSSFPAIKRNGTAFNFRLADDSADAAITAGNITTSAALLGSAQALSGAGAVNVTTTLTEYTSTGAAQALTLANGTAGQFKQIVHTVDGGSGILTPTTPLGYATITFATAGDAVDLVYTATGWAIVGSRGAVIA